MCSVYAEDIFRFEKEVDRTLPLHRFIATVQMGYALVVRFISSFGEVDQRP